MTKFEWDHVKADKDLIKIEDELRPEYNLMKLKIRRVGTERTTFSGQLVRLTSDDEK